MNKENLNITKDLLIEQYHIDSSIDSDNILDKYIINGHIDDSVKEMTNVPAVYFHNKDKSIYVGESTNVKNRIKSHMDSGNLKSDGRLIFYNSESFNASVVYDMETHLINHIRRLKDIHDLPFDFKNKKLDQGDPNYFQKAKYRPFIRFVKKDIHYEISEIIIKNKIMGYKEIDDYNKITNDPVYYANPNVISTNEQEDVLSSIFKNLEKHEPSLHVVSGSAGTGKTIVASKIFDKLMKDNYKGKVAFTSGIPDLTRSLIKMFKLDSKNSAFDNFEVNTVTKLTNKYWDSNEKLDILIIDEGHRLKKPGTGKAAFLVTQHIKTESQFTDLLNIARVVILIYDEDQVLMPVDKSGILNFLESDKQIYNYDLSLQMRSDDLYMQQIDALLNCSEVKKKSSVEIKIHNDFSEFYEALKRDKTEGLAPVIVSTLDRPRKINDKNYDQFSYGDINLSWMTKGTGWISSDDALDLKTVGYDNVIQGFERESIGVIVGKDLYYDEGQIKFNRKNTFNHFQWLKDDYYTSEKLAINRLKVLMTRSKQKLHVYVEDLKLRNIWIQHSS